MQESASVSSQLAEAAVLMGVGMLSVFIFLALLIAAMTLLARFVKTFPAPEQPASPQLVTPAVKENTTAKTDSSVLAAISAAVHQYRQSK